MLQQLSGMDAAFLYGETPNGHMGGGGIAIYDPSTAPGGVVTFDQVMDNVRQRLHLARTFRQRLVRVPFDIDHPYWMEDPDFDLEFHVREIALPAPGDWQQLCTQVARIMSRPLDLTRPLWELYMIDGIDSIDGVATGSFGLLTKFHHAAIDGMSGMEITTAIHDLEPVGTVAPPEQEWTPDEEPATWQLLSRATVNNAAKPWNYARAMVRRTPDVPGLVTEVGRQWPDVPGRGVPRTPFNGAVTPHRVFDARSFPLAEMNRIRAAAEGAKVNDVVLTVVGGALREYLAGRGELPDDPLVVGCPISVRTEEERSEAGNVISFMLASLATDVADPLARLEAIIASTHRSKAFAEAIGARTLVDTAQVLPGGLVGLAARTSSQFGLTARATPVMNTIVSNMPGPRVPLYFAGARLQAMYIAGMITDGAALIHPVTSYAGEIAIAFTSCREIMPDPDHYADCLQQSFEELSNATK